jgi:hypothetical protein
MLSGGLGIGEGSAMGRRRQRGDGAEQQAIVGTVTSSDLYKGNLNTRATLPSACARDRAAPSTHHLISCESHHPIQSRLLHRLVCRSSESEHLCTDKFSAAGEIAIGP